ncbi:MAG: zf-HC2 domain-containing protein [Candidatus Solibacter sp.]
MQHQEAIANKASERYLLGEMSEPERFAFEAHYFDCPECAGDVRAGEALSRAIHAVCAEEAALRPQTKVVANRPRRGWSAWLSPSSWVPSAAAVACGTLAAWQGLVVIPSLRWADNPQALAPVVLRAAARGEEQAIEIRRGQPVSALSLDINAAAPGAALRFDLVAPGGSVRYQGGAQAPPAGSALIVVLPNSVIGESGSWSLLLHTQAGEEIARYPFSVQLQ